MSAAIAEYEMTRAALRVGALFVLPMVLFAELGGGAAAAMTALGGVALVVGWFVLTALALGWVGERRPDLYPMVAVGGFGFRLGCFALAMPLLESVESLDGTSFAATVGVGVTALLAAEVRLVLRRSELWWVAPARISRPLGKAGRSPGRSGGARPGQAAPAEGDGKERQ